MSSWNTAIEVMQDLSKYIVSWEMFRWEPEGRFCRSKMFRWEPEGRFCRSKMFRWEPEGRFCRSTMFRWEPEGHFCRSKMFRWEPEGRYCHWLCTAIAPFWFSMEHLWAAITPFWLSTDDMRFAQCECLLIRRSHFWGENMLECYKWWHKLKLKSLLKEHFNNNMLNRDEKKRLLKCQLTTMCWHIFKHRGGGGNSQTGRERYFLLLLLLLLCCCCWSFKYRNKYNHTSIQKYRLKFSWQF